MIPASAGASRSKPQSITACTRRVGKREYGSIGPCCQMNFSQYFISALEGYPMEHSVGVSDIGNLLKTRSLHLEGASGNDRVSGCVCSEILGLVFDAN